MGGHTWAAGGFLTGRLSVTAVCNRQAECVLGMAVANRRHDAGQIGLAKAGGFRYPPGVTPPGFS